MAHNRKERVGDLIRQEIASLLLRGDIKDPRIGFVSITGVKMTPDLKKARVFFSEIRTESTRTESEAGLNSAAPHIRRVLAKILKLKSIPTLVFEYDNSIEYADRIERIIKEIKEDEGAA